VPEIKWYASVVVYADDVNKLGESTYATKKSRETSVVTSKATGLAVNTAKTKYMVMCSDQHIGQNYNIK
jgi:hypothetical protein